MPDKWEYPWFAAWDLAFPHDPYGPHRPRICQGPADSLLREWYMHPDGAIPAYEYELPM